MLNRARTYEVDEEFIGVEVRGSLITNFPDPPGQNFHGLQYGNMGPQYWHTGRGKLGATPVERCRWHLSTQPKTSFLNLTTIPQLFQPLSSCIQKFIHEAVNKTLLVKPIENRYNAKAMLKKAITCSKNESHDFEVKKSPKRASSFENII